MSGEFTIKRKYKLQTAQLANPSHVNGHGARWWFVVRGEEPSLVQLEEKWHLVAMHTNWKLTSLLQYAKPESEDNPSPSVSPQCEAGVNDSVNIKTAENAPPPPLSSHEHSVQPEELLAPGNQQLPESDATGYSPAVTDPQSCTFLETNPTTTHPSPQKHPR